MPPAGSGRNVFLTDAIDTCLDCPSIDPEDDMHIPRSELMDLDEFLLIHENRVSRDEELNSYNKKRETSDLLSKLLHTVQENIGLQQDIDEEDYESGSDDGKENNPELHTDHEYAARTPIDGSSKETEESMQKLPRKSERKNKSKRRRARTYKYNPKPVQQKTNRSFVPDVMKDEEYWERRKKNNMAAKKSREDRRAKELEVLQKMSKLESINAELAAKVEILEAKNAALEKKLKKLTS